MRIISLIFSIFFSIKAFSSEPLSNAGSRRWQVLTKSELQTPSWSAVGSVVNSFATGWCSGVAISPTLVLTAAHCLYYRAYEKDTDAFPSIWRKTELTHLKFYLQLHELSWSEKLEVIDVEHGDWITTKAPVDDWAILVLKNAITTQITYPKRAYKSSQDLQSLKAKALAQIGYPSTQQNSTPHLSKDCDVIPVASRETQNLILHLCDVQKGSSGGPLYYKNHLGEYVLVGITNHLTQMFHNANGFPVGVAIPLAVFQTQIEKKLLEQQ